MDGDTRHRLAAARLWAAHRFPYLASALFAMSVVEVDGLGGVAVDAGWRLHVDPDEIRDTSVDALGTMLVHHVAHLLRDHGGRASTAEVGESDSRRWIAAADAEINDDLVDAGLHLDRREVTPARLGLPDGRLAEEYYRDMGTPPAGPDHGSGADGRPRAWETGGEAGDGVSPAEADALRHRAAAEIMEVARAAGDVSGGWQRWAREMVGPTVDWRRVLGAEIRHGVASAAGLVDYTYRRPSRRAGVSEGVILPALERPVPHVAIVCDTSASVTEDELGMALAEVDGIIGRLGVRDPVVLSVDAAVQRLGRGRRGAMGAMLGGGGTDMAVGIEAAAAMRPRPDVIVVLTDGHTRWPERPRGITVVVGLLSSAAGLAAAGGPPPGWARVVEIPRPATAPAPTTRALS